MFYSECFGILFIELNVVVVFRCEECFLECGEVVGYGQVCVVCDKGQVGNVFGNILIIGIGDDDGGNFVWIVECDVFGDKCIEGVFQDNGMVISEGVNYVCYVGCQVVQCNVRYRISGIQGFMGLGM